MTLSRALIGGPSVAEIGEIDVTETTHGFVVGNLVYNNGTAWLKADGSDSTKSADGIVTASADANTFSYSNLVLLTLTTGEWDAVAGTTGGLTPGENYRLSELTAGELTETGPAASGITQWILKSLSTTKALVYFGDPQEIGVNGEAIVSSTNEGRIGVHATDPIGTGLNSGTLYFHRYIGDRIALFDGTDWGYHTIADTPVSIALSGGTASVPVDVWAYDNAGTIALEITAWSTTTARVTAIARQDGVYVKSGTTTRRYLGTVGLNGSKQATDDSTRLDVWNASNRISRTIQAVVSGFYTHAVIETRKAGGLTTGDVYCTKGVDGLDSVFGSFTAKIGIGSTAAQGLSIGKNGTTVWDQMNAASPCYTVIQFTAISIGEGPLGIGTNYLAALDVHLTSTTACSVEAAEMILTAEQ